MGSYPDTEVVFIFHDSRRPDCLFGFRWGTFWEWIVGEDHVREHGAETPRSLAVVILVNFDEARELHLPRQCDPAAINWIR